MPKRKKSSGGSVGKNETRTIEFTPAQVLAAIITLIVFGLICFILGIVVNIVDQNLGEGAGAELAAVADDAIDGEGEQRTPESSPERTSPTPPVSREKAPDPEKEVKTVDLRKRFSDTSSRPGAKGSDKESPPSEGPAEVEVADLPETDAEGNAVEEPPVETTASPPVAASEPAEPDERKPAGEESGSSAPAPSESEGNWIIQLAAYSVENTQQAEDFATRLRENTDLEPRLVTSDDGKWVRVWIGNFSDRAAAIAKQTELQKIEQFKNCIVKRGA